jgi:hypothetical protein
LASCSDVDTQMNAAPNVTLHFIRVSEALTYNLRLVLSVFTPKILNKTSDFVVRVPVSNTPTEAVSNRIVVPRKASARRR